MRGIGFDRAGGVEFGVFRQEVTGEIDRPPLALVHRKGRRSAVEACQHLRAGGGEARLVHGYRHLCQGRAGEGPASAGQVRAGALDAKQLVKPAGAAHPAVAIGQRGAHRADERPAVAHEALGRGQFGVAEGAGGRQHQHVVAFELSGGQLLIRHPARIKAQVLQQQGRAFAALFPQVIFAQGIFHAHGVLRIKDRHAVAPDRGADQQPPDAPADWLVLVGERLPEGGVAQVRLEQQPPGVDGQPGAAAEELVEDAEFDGRGGAGMAAGPFHQIDIASGEIDQFIHAGIGLDGREGFREQPIVITEVGGGVGGAADAHAKVRHGRVGGGGHLSVVVGDGIVPEGAEIAPGAEIGRAFALEFLERRGHDLLPVGEGGVPLAVQVRQALIALLQPLAELRQVAGGEGHLHAPLGQVSFVAGDVIDGVVVGIPPGVILNRLDRIIQSLIQFRAPRGMLRVAPLGRAVVGDAGIFHEEAHVRPPHAAQHRLHHPFLRVDDGGVGPQVAEPLENRGEQVGVEAAIGHGRSGPGEQIRFGRLARAGALGEAHGQAQQAAVQLPPIPQRYAHLHPFVQEVVQLQFEGLLRALGRHCFLTHDAPKTVGQRKAQLGGRCGRSGEFYLHGQRPLGRQIGTIQSDIGQRHRRLQRDGPGAPVHHLSLRIAQPQVDGAPAHRERGGERHGLLAGFEVQRLRAATRNLPPVGIADDPRYLRGAGLARIGQGERGVRLGHLRILQRHL